MRFSLFSLNFVSKLCNLVVFVDCMVLPNPVYKVLQKLKFLRITINIGLSLYAFTCMGISYVESLIRVSQKYGVSDTVAFGPFTPLAPGPYCRIVF